MNNLTKNRVYYAAIYVRLSKEDGDKEESDSIRNQRDLIRNYLADKPDISVCAEYVDDGYSGASFQRPGFKAMLQEMEAGRIDCVVVKDLSRFGRNFVESGRYLDQIFPAMGIRFIAINDHYDSIQGSASSDKILVPFKNLINDAYCRDISIKIRSQLEIKRKKGDFIGSFAVYGYCKSPEDHHKLMVDEYAAGIVQDIFKWKLEGASQQRIADRLNARGELSPMEYKRSRGLRYKSGFQLNPRTFWTAVSVGRILRNINAFAFTDSLLGEGVTYETAGSLQNGRRVWVLAKLPQRYIISGDEITPYLVFMNSHDGTGAIKAAMTPIRVVCMNTLNLALSTAKRSWSTNHVGDIQGKLEDARHTLLYADLYMQELGKTIDKLNRQKLSDRKVFEYIDALFPLVDNASEQQKKNLFRMKEEVKTRYYDAPDLAHIEKNAYRFVNAVSDFATHAKPLRERANYWENLFARTVDGNAMIDKAFDLVKAI